MVVEGLCVFLSVCVSLCNESVVCLCVSVCVTVSKRVTGVSQVISYKFYVKTSDGGGQVLQSREQAGKDVRIRCT